MTVGGSGHATAARERLRTLEADGARAFDGAALAFVEALLRRGEALPGHAGARLIARAIERADALERELATARRRAQEARGESSTETPAPGAIEPGAIHLALRAARRRRVAASRAPADPAWAARLLAEARARRVRVEDPAATPGALAAALYSASRAEVSAMLVAARAQADVHAHAGPYNSVAIAARALGELSGLAPAYMTALVALLDELAPLLTLPDSPSEPRAPGAAAGPRRRPLARRPR